MIQIGQTLHGYEDGHSLLASSGDLPYEAESTLFVLSDLSGQSFVGGFDAYLTGYPLSDMHSYALAKTWYAPEMDRPGCVWTHTLIIRFGDLARINDFESLLGLFVRPTRNSKTWARYESRITFDESSAPDNRVADVGDRIGNDSTEICNALYGNPDSPVVVPGLQSLPFERSFLKIWAQQWPRLRRNFSFCTGSIEAREVGGRPFDLQCMPSNYSSLGSMLPHDAIIIGQSLPAHRLPDHILLLIVDDLNRPNDSLRHFMRNYGADAPGERASFAAITEIWDQLQSGIADEEAFVALLERVSRFFPARESVAKLKRDMVLDEEVASLPIVFPVQDRLIALLRMESQDNAARFINIWPLIDELIDKDAEGFIRLLDRLIRLNRLSGVTTILLQLAVSRISYEAIEQTASQQLLLVLASLHPQLLRHPYIRKTLCQRGYELVDIFAARKSSEGEWRELLEALIDNELQQTASLAFNRAPIDLTPAVLDIFEQSSSYRDSFAAWFTEVERRQPSAVNWLKNRESLSEANRLGLSLVLDPVYCSQLKVPATLFRGVEQEKNERRLTFLFVLSANDRVPDSAWMFSITFRKIHRFVTREELGYYSWRILQQVLPELSFFGNWNMAERLRRYYATKYAASGWPERAFWEGLEGREVTWEVLDYIASEKSLRLFGRSLISRSHEFALPSWQVDIINKAPKKLRG